MDNLIGAEFEGVFCIDLEFRARHKILSLPYWHGARWHAYLREACHFLPYTLEDLVLACRPERNGLQPVLEGDKLVLHLLTSAEARERLPLFFACIATTGNSGEFSANTLDLLNARDAITGKVIWEPASPTDFTPQLFFEEFLYAQADALSKTDHWTLQLISPLRLPLPPGHPGRGKELSKYAPAAFMKNAEGLQWLLGRLRFMDNDATVSVESICPDPHDQELYWEDMRYSKQRKIALGGICGHAVWHGRPSFATALRLVLGPYLGTGKNPRFGLGFWKIPELNSV